MSGIAFLFALCGAAMTAGMAAVVVALFLWNNREQAWARKTATAIACIIILLLWYILSSGK